MAIQNITYGDKTDLNTTSVANINKVSASDLNEIKSVVNNNGTEVSNLQNYSTNEVVIGKWTNDKPIYRKVLSGTLPTGSGDNTFTISDSEVISVNGFVKSQYGIWFNTNGYFTEAGYIISCYLNSARNTITLKCGSFYNTSSQYFMVVEYTKTTD